MKDDTVSRAAVIETIKSHFRVDNDLLEVIVYEVAHLPAVQTCEDAVSRADVIELVKDSYYNLAESIEDTWAMVADVEKLPAVQPEPKPDKNGSEPFGNAEMLSDRTTDDCISRQAAIDALHMHLMYRMGTDSNKKRLDDWINGVPSAQPKRTCVNCGRTINNGGWYADGGTRCPIEEHYALPKDGYCHLWEKRNVTDDDYPERREE